MVTATNVTFLTVALYLLDLATKNRRAWASARGTTPINVMRLTSALQ
jgi:hypothetical protein